MKKNLYHSILDLIESTSSELPGDVARVLDKAMGEEKDSTSSQYALTIIEENRQLAKRNKAPICQDTGTISFYVSHPRDFDRLTFEQIATDAVKEATRKGILRENSVDSLTGKNSGDNTGAGHPNFSYEASEREHLEIKLMLKGGGCENVGAQYSLPNTQLGAGRDLEGVKKVILDCVKNAQGKGCSPGILGICIGGDRASGYGYGKKQLLRYMDDENSVKELKAMEEEVLAISNQLGIGVMGLGGKTTLLGVKIGTLNRLPASFFVSISYMCWAFRRQGILLDNNFEIKKWIYR